MAEPAADGQRLSLPAWIPGSYLIRDFSRQIESLAAYSGARRVAVNKLDNHTWQAAPCDGPLRVEYEVYAWDLSVRGAHLDETHGFFNGTSVFLRVHGQEQLPCLVDLAPPRGIEGWTVHTSLPEARGLPGAARRHGFGLYRAPDYDALIDHPVEMGTPQVVSFTAHGAEHELVFTGVAPKLDLARIADDVRRICETQIAFFEPRTRRAPFLDSADRYVFMTMVTNDGYGGLEHRASTALMTARKDLPVLGQQGQGEGYRGFLGLVSHEYFHTWNVKRIKPAAFAPYDLSQPDLTRLLWVFEGFTSYYDDLLLLRSGAITQADYLRLLAKTITGVARTPGRLKQSVAESSFDAWTRYYKQDENSPNALVSYYTKGSLVALGLDLLIRQETAGARSLDDVMRLLWQRHGRDFYQGRPQGLAEDGLPALIREATGVDARRFIARHAYGTLTCRWPSCWNRKASGCNGRPPPTSPRWKCARASRATRWRWPRCWKAAPATRAGCRPVMCWWPSTACAWTRRPGWNCCWRNTAPATASRSTCSAATSCAPSASGWARRRRWTACSASPASAGRPARRPAGNCPARGGVPAAA